MTKRSTEIPVVLSDEAIRSATQVDDNSGDEDAEFPVFGQVLSQISSGERPTETQTFTIKGKRYKFQIYVDGREDAELWSKLSTALMWGYSLETAARLAGKPFEGITETIPIGAGIKRITIKDPAYIGSVKVLSLVIKKPEWGWDECLMMGNALGQGFVEVCEWAAQRNGVTEDYMRKYEELEKNAANLSRLNG